LAVLLRRETILPRNLIQRSGFVPVDFRVSCVTYRRRSNVLNELWGDPRVQQVTITSSTPGKR
jgi:hypothetical protein